MQDDLCHHMATEAVHELKAKSQSNALLSLARYVAAQGAGHYIEALASFHSAEINPNELTVGASIFGDLATQIPKGD